MPTEPQPLTVAEAVQRAVNACELGEPDEALDELLLRFEDADTPIRGLDDIEQRLDEVLGTIDAEWEESGALAMARAVVVYLAYRRDEAQAQPEELLRLAARAEFEGEPPRAVADWLAQAGVTV